MLNPLSCGILFYELLLWTMFVMHKELLLQKGFAFHAGIVYHCNIFFCSPVHGNALIGFTGIEFCFVQCIVT